MNKFRSAIAGAFITILLVSSLTACTATDASQQKGGETAKQEQQAVQTGFNRLSNSQQIPTFDWSQERQTLIDVETIRATGATSTTAGYLEGVGLIWWCPSIGAPVPSTYQLSASQQWVDLPGDHTYELKPVDQGEPTGVYIGQSTGTWTICLDDNGKKFGKYWEGYTDSTTGIITTYPADKRVVVSDVTFKFTDNPSQKK